RPRDRHAEHESLALPDRADAAQDLLVGEKIQTPELIVGAPAPPILRRVLQQCGVFDWFVCHGVLSSAGAKLPPPVHWPRPPRGPAARSPAAKAKPGVCSFSGFVKIAGAGKEGASDEHF